jgi:diguanylate cyclase (GGDEF)-like protein
VTTGRARAIRNWPLWQLPTGLRCHIIGVTGLWLSALALAASRTTYRTGGIALFTTLLGLGALTVELTRHADETTGLVKDYFCVWHLPIAILLPPCYALLAPTALVTLTQIRVRRAQPHRRVFTAAALGLSYGAASLTFPILARPAPGAGRHALTWAAAVATCAAIRWAVNNALVIPAIIAATRPARPGALLAGPELARSDLAELCIGVLVTYAVAGNPALAVLAVPFVTLLQRSLQHAQLRDAARTDPKTGLLNPAAWQQAAEAELARAARTRAPLAIAMIDIDHFKHVNDTHGHQAGDHVLQAVAATLARQLRAYDLAGRFGGEEFIIALPHTTAPGALQIAERLRSQIAATPTRVTTSAEPGPVRVTVSIGVAATTGGPCALHDLIAAADDAMYQAKHAGRDRVAQASSPARRAGTGAAPPATHARCPGEPGSPRIDADSAEPVASSQLQIHT